MERDLVQFLRQLTLPHPRAVVGIGDDAAVLRLAAGAHLVATTDMLMDGVDFRCGEHDLALIGCKSIAVNLSDLAAMAARPVAVLVSLALPRSDGQRIARELYDGILPIVAEYDVSLAGGDTNSWDGPLVISVTALGEVRPGHAWLRSGARPGDAIVVTGDFGGSILGHHFRFQPRVREALWLAENAQVRAAIDVSDGLSLDLSRLAEESRCGAVLDLDRIPISSSARELAEQRRDGVSALEHALADGEDFELLMAIESQEAQRLLILQPLPVPLRTIGRFVDQPGLWTEDASGKLVPLTPRGYEHRLE